MNKPREKLIAIGAVLLIAGAGYLLSARFFGGDGDDKAERDESEAPAPAAKGGSEEVPPPMSPQQQAVTMDDDPEGPLRLEGQVQDDGGEGVGGALVTLTSNPPRTAVSEEDGSFAFDKLIGRTYALRARAGNQVGGPITYKLSEESDPAIIRMRAGGAVEVTVVAESTGKPIAGATVALRELDIQSEQTNADGVARFQGVGSGWFVLVAAAPGFGSGRQALMMPSTPNATLKARLALVPGVHVAGVVIDDAGAAVAGAVVTAHRVGQVFDGVDPRYDGVTTDAKGTFALDGVPIGKTQLVAMHKDYAAGRSEILDLTDGIDGVSITMTVGGQVAGRVVTTDKQPVPWASIAVKAKSDASGNWGNSPRGTTADEKGNFEIKGLPRSVLSLLASSDAASSDLLNVDLEAKQRVDNLDVVLSITGTISGVVVNSEGAPVPEVQVILYPDWTSGHDMERFALRQGDSKTTNGDGAFTFSGLIEGTYMLKATRDSANTLFWQAKGERAVTGATGVVLKLESDGKVVGTVVSERGDPITSYTVTVGWPPGHPFAEPSGRFELSSIPPGKYDLKIKGADFADTTVRDVEVAADKTTDVGKVTVVRGRLLTGRVIEGGGSAVSGAQVVMAVQLVGTGDQLSLSNQASTDELMGIRRATTDSDGRFRVRGLANKELVVAAEHRERGRSRPQTLPLGPPELDIVLELLPTGSVVGTVRRGDAPATAVNVIATPSEARGQMVAAQADDKGAYNLTRLSEGAYEISALFGGGLSQTGVTRKVVVKGGQEQTVDLVFLVGDVTLAIEIKPEPGATVDAVQVFLFPGEVAVNNGKEVTDAFLGRESSGAGMAFSMKGNAVKFVDQRPEKKTLCGIPITGDMGDAQFLQRLQENAVHLIVVCRTIEVTEAPTTQTATLVVPQMKPLPNPDGERQPGL